MQRADIVINYIKAGALLPLDEYLPDMPNFTKRYKDLIPYWRLNSEDGMLYNWETAIPRHLDTDIEDNDMHVRSDALELVDWKMPLSADEWVEFLIETVPQMKDVDGKPVVGLTFPLAEGWGLAGLVPILYEKGDTYQAVSNEAFTFNLKTELFEDYFKAPPVKESIKFFNDLYQGGVLDEECFTDTQDITGEKQKKGSTVSVFYVGWHETAVNQALAESGNENMQYIAVPIQSNAQVAAGEKREIRIEASRPFDSWGLTTNCKYPERLLELIEYMTTDEGQILLRSGVEGVHWNTENGERVPTDELIKAVTDPTFNETQGVGGWNNGLPSFNLLAVDGQPHGVTQTQAFRDTKSLTARQQEAFESLGWSSSRSWYLENGFFAPSGMSTAVYIDPTTDLGKTGVKMTELRKRYSTKLIMAETDDDFEAIWNEAMEAYAKLNPSAYIDEMNRLLIIQAEKLEQYR